MALRSFIARAGLQEDDAASKSMADSQEDLRDSVARTAAREPKMEGHKLVAEAAAVATTLEVSKGSVRHLGPLKGWLMGLK